MKALRLLLALTLAWLLCASKSRADEFGNRAWGKSAYQSVITPDDELQTLVRYQENPTGYGEIASGREVWTKFDPEGLDTIDQYTVKEEGEKIRHASIMKGLDDKKDKMSPEDYKAKVTEENDRDKRVMDEYNGKISDIESSAKEMQVDAKTLDDDSMDFKNHQLERWGNLAMMLDSAGEIKGAVEGAIEGGGKLIAKILGKDGAKGASQEIAELGPLSGLSKDEIEAKLKAAGYSSTPASNGGVIWTKVGADGNTAAVRIDPAMVRSTPKGFADEVPHVHKETVPTSNVSGGNYSPASATKLNDQGAPTTDPLQSHIPGGH